MTGRELKLVERSSVKVKKGCNHVHCSMSRYILTRRHIITSVPYILAIKTFFIKNTDKEVNWSLSYWKRQFLIAIWNFQSQNHLFQLKFEVYYLLLQWHCHEHSKSESFLWQLIFYHIFRNKTKICARTTSLFSSVNEGLI